MSYASRNNGKITSRNQGGGTKLQGLGPTSTSYYIANKNASTYYSEVGDGSNRNYVMCVNQLGGMGRYRSQFRPNADGNRGTFCVKPLLSAFNFDARNIELGNPRCVLAVFLNRFDVANTFSDFSYSNANGFVSTLVYVLSSNDYKVNFGGTDLDICSNSLIFFDTTYNNSGSIIFAIVSPNSNNTFADNTYEYLKSLKYYKRTNQISIGKGVTHLLSGYNLTVTSKSNPSESVNFNSLTNENYYSSRNKLLF